MAQGRLRLNGVHRPHKPYGAQKDGKEKQVTKNSIGKTEKTFHGNLRIWLGALAPVSTPSARQPTPKLVLNALKSLAFLRRRRRLEHRFRFQERASNGRGMSFTNFEKFLEKTFRRVLN